MAPSVGSSIPVSKYFVLPGVYTLKLSVKRRYLHPKMALHWKCTSVKVKAPRFHKFFSVFTIVFFLPKIVCVMQGPAVHVQCT